jgi:hypothetical protein
MASMCLLASMGSAFAQGTILFDTLEVGARVYDLECEPLSGDGFVAQLYARSEATETFQPVGMPVPFGEGDAAGYVQGGAVVVPFVPSFIFAEVMMRVWESQFPTYEQALTSGLSMVGQTTVLSIGLGTEDQPAMLFGMETLWGGCPSHVVLKVARGDSSVELTWSMQGFPSFYLVVPQEADTPLGSWGDIDGPWNQEAGRINPPNPIQLTIPSTTKFYRMRITTNIGG